MRDGGFYFRGTEFFGLGFKCPNGGGQSNPLDSEKEKLADRIIELEDENQRLKEVPPAKTELPRLKGMQGTAMGIRMSAIHKDKAAGLRIAPFPGIF